MSILLDSLRKSEAQRKGREAPTIHSTHEYDSHSRRTTPWPAWLVGGLAVAAMAWFGFVQYADPGSETASVKTDAAGTHQAIETSARSGARESGGEEQPRSPVARLDAPTDSGTREEADDRSGAVANRIAEFTAQNEEGEAYEDAFDSGAYLESEIADETTSDEDMRDDFTEIERSGTERSADFSGLGPDVRSYWQLPQAYRNEMPEFRITVLVYADEPEDRFLLINGERLREGDELEGGVVLEEIRREGAVFSYRQTRFLVKS